MGTLTLKNSKLSITINSFLYFFVSKLNFETAIFSETNFHTSLNSYNYIILNNIFMFYGREVYREVKGKYREVKGKLGGVLAQLPFQVSL
jgi:hypothetical protein